MSVQTTPNLGLTLPYQTDPVAVSTQNDNMTIIDTAYGTLNSKFITQIGNSKVDAGISNGNGIRTINFNKSFSYAPAIALTPLIASDSSATSYIRTCVIEEITATQCKFREVAQQIGGSTFVDGTDPVYWIAVSS